jgi:lauroyl/myristoyl acyltransferase
VAFGDEFSTERRAQIVRESYQHFVRTMLDFFWSPRLTSQNFSRYVEFENREAWDEQDTRPGKPVVVGCYHYSNFEWLSIVSAFAGLEGVVIAQQFKNPLLDPIFLKLRQRSGHRVAPRKGAVMHLYRALRRGERFALLGDLTISATLPIVTIKCFGLERCVSFAHVWLHQRTGAPLINVHREPLPGGCYRVVFHPGLNFPRALRSRKWRKLAGTSSSWLSGKIPHPGSGCTSIGDTVRWRRIWRPIHSTRIFRRISSAVSMKARAIFRR